MILSCYLRTQNFLRFTIHLRTFDKGLALDPKDWRLFIMWATTKKMALLSIESWLFHRDANNDLLYSPYILCRISSPKNTLSTTIGCFMFHWKLPRSDTLKRLATATNVVTWIGWRVVGSRVWWGNCWDGSVVKIFIGRDLDTPVEVDSLAQMFTLQETNIAPENRASQKEISSSNHWFSGVMLVSGRVHPICKVLGVIKFNLWIHGRLA